jgi:hypothetical protein
MKNSETKCSCGCIFDKLHEWQTTCESCADKRRYEAIYGHVKPETLEEIEE